MQKKKNLLCQIIEAVLVTFVFFTCYSICLCFEKLSIKFKILSDSVTELPVIFFKYLLFL